MEVGLVGGAVAEESDRDVAGRWAVRAAPVAAAIEPPTIPKQPISPFSRSTTFIEPARPPQTPVARPSISATSASGSVPAARRGRGRGRCRRPSRPRRAPADADRDGLLAGVEVRRAVDLALEEEPVDLVLEVPDHQHPAVAVERRRALCARASVRRASRHRARRPQAVGDRRVLRKSSRPRRGACTRSGRRSRRRGSRCRSAPDDLLGGGGDRERHVELARRVGAEPEVLQQQRGVNIGLKSRFTYAGVL